MSEWQALILALALGIGYNALIANAQRTQPADHGLTALWVVIGVAGVLLVSCTVKHSTDWLALYWQGKAIRLSNAQHAAWYEFKFFAAAGLPMVLGSLWRFYKRL